MKKIAAYLRGLYEFRSNFTWSDNLGEYTDLDHAYDRGREMAHRITFRLFED